MFSTAVSGGSKWGTVLGVMSDSSSGGGSSSIGSSSSSIGSSNSSSSIGSSSSTIGDGGRSTIIVAVIVQK
jgi:hypothetical protein